MPFTAQQIIDRVRGILIDPDGTRWTNTELFRYMSDGCRAIVALKPSSNPLRNVMTLTAGTRQTLPADAFMLLNVTRNLGVNGTTPGRAIRIVSREILDGINPSWHTETAAATVTNYMFDPMEQTAFYVYPPNTGTGTAEVIYAATPAEITLIGQNITLQDVYIVPLTDYVLARAHMKDGDFSGGPQVAQGYMQSFAQFLGATTQVENADNPNLTLLPTAPEPKGMAR